jgi:hypothetical protein
MPDGHRVLFRKLDAAVFCSVGLIVAWMTFGASPALVALTLASAVMSALVVGRELKSDITP